MIHILATKEYMERLKNPSMHQEKTFRSEYGLIDSLARQTDLENITISCPEQINYDKKDFNPYEFTGDKSIIKSNKSLEDAIVLVLADGSEKDGFEISEIHKQHKLFNELLKTGFIKEFIDSPVAKETNDKLKTYNLFRHMKPITTTCFENKNNAKKYLTDYLQENSGIICKHRFGSNGKHLYKFNKTNYLEGIDSLDSINDYIFQPEADIHAESRIMFLDYKIIGARIIEDRTRPWEDKKSGREHLRKQYTPSEFEHTKTIEIAKKIEMQFGSVDWLHLKDGSIRLLEINDAGTALISTENDGTIIYNVCEDLAKYAIKRAK